MGEAEFWIIIENANNQSNGDEEETRELIKGQLRLLNVEQIVSLYITYYKLIKHSRSYDLWAAGYLLRNSCSNDGFFEFQEWLIAQGKQIFYKALENPEILANIRVEDLWYSFDLPGCFNDVYEEKTGKDIYHISIPVSLDDEDWKGEKWFDWHEKRLQIKYPKLAAKGLLNKKIRYLREMKEMFDQSTKI